nr:hypothetical protein EEL55_20130 [Bacillus thuringiensis]
MRNNKKWKRKVFSLATIATIGVSCTTLPNHASADTTEKVPQDVSKIQEQNKNNREYKIGKALLTLQSDNFSKKN